MAVTAHYRLTSCGTNSATIGPGHQLLAGCGTPGRSTIIDRTNSVVLADYTTVGGSDEVWFNPGDNRYYLAQTGAQNLGVSDANTLQVVDNVQSGVGAHSVASHLATNHVFVPIGGPEPACPNGRIAVYSSVKMDSSGLSRLN